MQSIRAQIIHNPRIASLLQFRVRFAAVEPYQLYGWAISVCGLVVLGWGLYAIALSSYILDFLILLALVVVASIPATSSALARITSFTFSLPSVVAIASIPAFGAEAAIVLASSAHLFIWWFKPKDSLTWKKTWTQLVFNSAMDGLAMAVAGAAYIGMLWFIGDGPFSIATGWFLAVILFVLTNLSILYMMVRLQHGADVTIALFIRNIGWSIGLGYIVHALGGGFLASAISQYDTQGIVIFFLPIFLSAFAFQLYSKEMQVHLDNLEEIIDERTAELAQLNSEKDAFLAVLTHDMNSPLNTIKLTFEMIQRKPAIVAERPHMIDRVIRAQTMLQQLVSDIVDLGKLEAGKSLELKFATLDLVKLTKETVEEQLSRAQSKSIQLRISEMPEMLHIDADHYHIQRVLTNIISNAIKYTHNMGEVNVSVFDRADTVEVMVQDSGYGIPEADLPYIFDPYRRVASNSDKAQGTGLGLSITKAIAEAHNGTITVESEEGKGSIFRILLPVHPSSVAKLS